MTHTSAVIEDDDEMERKSGVEFVLQGHILRSFDNVRLRLSVALGSVVTHLPASATRSSPIVRIFGTEKEAFQTIPKV